MYEVIYNKKFKSAFKRIVRSGRFDREAFEEILECLADGKELPSKYHDHALTGNLFGHRECHIAGDTLLVYEIHVESNKIILDDIGNHAQIFRS